tara:strand:- start:748 stop:1668 length:921 start_codon:yes stop_codon:yes gene_type:complete
VNIGIFGVGSFGEKHINVLKMINSFQIIGFFDPDKKRQQYIQSKYHIKAYQDPIQLIRDSVVIDIVSNTETHYEIIELGIQHNKHIFVEKPICFTQQEVEKLITYSKTYKSILQVGHIERYNPLISKEIIELKEIQSISSKRTGALNTRNSKIPITLDLMIHDIDLILSIIKSKITAIKAMRKKNKQSEGKELISCEMKFQNGKMAYLTAARGTQNIRTMTIECINEKFSLDLLNLKKSIIDKETQQKKQINTHIKTQHTNPLKNAFLDFQQRIKKNIAPKVSIQEGCQAVQVALEIEKLINHENN